jgi:hypothetical protein
MAQQAHSSRELPTKHGSDVVVFTSIRVELKSESRQLLAQGMATLGRSSNDGAAFNEQQQGMARRGVGEGQQHDAEASTDAREGAQFAGVFIGAGEKTEGIKEMNESDATINSEK